jgi:hypothetical protein
MFEGFLVKKSPGTWRFWPFSLAAALFTRDTGVQLCKSEHPRAGGGGDGERKRVEKKQAGDVFFHGHHPLSACSVVRGGNSCRLKQSVLTIYHY